MMQTKRPTLTFVEFDSSKLQSEFSSLTQCLGFEPFDPTKIQTGCSSLTQFVEYDSTILQTECSSKTQCVASDSTTVQTQYSSQTQCVEFDSCGGCKVGLVDFIAIYHDTPKLRTFLISHGVLSDKCICAKCGNTLRANWNSNTFRCRRRVEHNGPKKEPCGFRISIFDNTFFSQTRLSYESLSLFIVLWITRDPPQYSFLHSELGWTSNTIVDWSSFCRDVCSDFCLKQRKMLGGGEKRVEIHGEKIRKRKPVAGTQWIFVGVEKCSENIFITAFDTEDNESLLSVIKEHVNPGTKLVSKSWKSYKDCLSVEEISDLKVNHKITFLDQKNERMPGVECVWREVRSKVLKFVRKKSHYNGCLAEYMFKREYPDHRDRIHIFFKAVGQLYRPHHIKEARLSESIHSIAKRVDDEDNHISLPAVIKLLPS